MHPRSCGLAAGKMTKVTPDAELEKRLYFFAENLDFLRFSGGFCVLFRHGTLCPAGLGTKDVEKNRLLCHVSKGMRAILWSLDFMGHQRFGAYPL
jgi:hypothetical protein